MPWMESSVTEETSALCGPRPGWGGRDNVCRDSEYRARPAARFSIVTRNTGRRRGAIGRDARVGCVVLPMCPGWTVDLLAGHERR